MAEDAGIEQWLEALDARECTAEEFLQQVLELEAQDPEVCWQALALLDQHFRRQLIPQETYSALKSQLHRHWLDHSRLRNADAAAVMPPPVQWLPPPATPPHSRRATRSDAEAQILTHQQLLVGEVLCGRYRVVDVLHRDATCTLVEAIDEPKARMPGVRQRLAICVFNAADCRSPESLQRIGRLQALSHPAIPRIFDVEQDRALLLLTMELLKGATLAELLERGRRPDRAFILSLLHGVASALEYAHAQDVAHGEVGVSNVFVTDLGEVRLRGFGMSRVTDAAGPAADRMAFAWLVYELLGGLPAERGDDARSQPLRKPAGMTRSDWRTLRQALQGEEEAGVALLATFASADGGAGRVDPLAGIRRTQGQRSGGRTWLAVAVLVIAMAAAFLYLGQRDSQTQQVVQAAQPVAPVRSEVVLPEVPTVQQDVDPPVIAESPPPQSLTSTAQPAARPRIDFVRDAAWVDTTQAVARIWVRRRGNLDQAVSFQWWTESGSALPDRDFHAVVPRVEVIRKGAAGVELRVPLIPDVMRGEARTFFVKIDAPGEGAALGARTLMQVAIVPPGYPAARDSR